jgi:hypothetical protein
MYAERCAKAEKIKGKLDPSVFESWPLTPCKGQWSFTIKRGGHGSVTARLREKCWWLMKRSSGEKPNLQNFSWPYAYSSSAKAYEAMCAECDKI